MARAYTNAELVAAVGAAGGLGILGCLWRPADEAVAEIRRIRTPPVVVWCYDTPGGTHREYAAGEKRLLGT